MVEHFYVCGCDNSCPRHGVLKHPIGSCDADEVIILDLPKRPKKCVAMSGNRDAVRSLQVVTADGRQSEIDGTHDADLFWALRGGGAGLAAVTALTVAVRPALNGSPRGP